MNPLRIGLMLGALAVSACVPRREPAPPAPQPEAVPRPQPPLQEAPPPSSPAVDWTDLPPTPGTWLYRNEGAATLAAFGSPEGPARFVVRCERAGRQIRLLRQGITTGNTMRIRTSSGTRNFPLSIQAEPTPYVYGAAPADDRFLDAIAFSRGRFTVEVPGTPMLVLPAWPEPARVIEDCRG